MHTESAPEYRLVSPEYLRALSVRLIDGRWFDERDHNARPASVLISRSYARYYFGDKNPLGSIFNRDFMNRSLRGLSLSVNRLREAA
jgi:hypothetical protein